jgi:LmbE family N-acetylglucosaminyl deacetylase
VFKLTSDLSKLPIEKVLCLGAHCDDIEIGAGGTIMRLLQQSNPDFHWVVLSSTNARAAEARRSARLFLGSAAAHLEVLNFRERFFPYAGAEIKEYFDTLGRSVSPDIIFTHKLEDRHQDHRLVAELTWNTFRDHLILEYEIPKYEGDLGHPNLFVHLDRHTVHQKLSSIVDSFTTQQEKYWFSKETLEAVMRLRGVESRSATGYAEGFVCRKLVLT